LLAGSGFVLAGTDMLGMFRSTDNGTTFSPANTGLGSAWIQCMTQCGANIYAGTGESGLYVSSDNGLSWSVVPAIPATGISALASGGNVIVVSTIDSTLFISSNAGTSWNQLNTLIPADKITSLAVCYNNVVAGTQSNGLFLSADQGAAWNPVSVGELYNPEIRCLFSFYNLVFAGTAEGELVYSQDSGNTWVLFSWVLDDSPILSLFTGSSGLYAGVNGGGVWSIPLCQLVTGTPQPESLNAEVFPNPVNQFAEIEWKGGKNIQYTLSDISGKVMTTGILRGGYGIIPTEAIPCGFYIISFSDGKFGFSKEIEIVH